MPKSLGDVVAEFLREDPWDAVKKRFQKVGNDLWAYIENAWYAVVMEWDPEFSKEDTFGDSEEESDQVVSQRSLMNSKKRSCGKCDKTL